MHLSIFSIRFHHILLWLFLKVCPAVVFTQSPEVSFEAYTDAKEVLTGSYFEVTFTLKNANGTGFSPPDFKGFNEIAGPNSSTSMQIVNGQVTREMGYSYTLQPKKEGVFTIGKATIKANGKILSTSPLSIKVSKGNAPAGNDADNAEKAYVVVEPNKYTAYPGEQILLDFKLYTTVSLDGYDITEEPEYRGFYVQEMRRFNSKTLREVINGKQVTTKVLRRLVLFPQQTGTLTIPPARIQLAVLEDNGRSGFFFSRNIKPVFIETDPVTITVKELPSPSPESFTGAVGLFEFQASVNRRQATTDDAISVTMMILGDGDVKRVQPPQLSLSDSFELYPPKIMEENITENQGGLIGRKMIEYLVLPKFPGNYSIEPSFSFFNTQTMMYENLTAGPYNLQVKQGTDRHISQIKPQEKEDISHDIRFIKRESLLEKKGQYLMDSPVFLIAVGLPLIAFIGLYFFKKAKINSTQLEGSAMRTKQANKMALQRLSVANGYLQNGLSRAFYDEVSKASLGYVCDKMGIPLSELSKENMQEKMRSIDIPSPLIDDFIQIIQTCEKAIFAGMDNPADMQNIYDRTVELIGGIEDEIGII